MLEQSGHALVTILPTRLTGPVVVLFRPTLQLPLSPSLPQFLAYFHAVNLPFLVLNAARLAAAGEPRKARTCKSGEAADPLAMARHAAKLATAGKVSLD